MRMSRLLLKTLRDAPADAEAVSHQLLVRAGYIRRLASGIYSFLPLGLRVLHNVTRVVQEELDRAGAQEVLLPALHPLEVWQASGRDKLLNDVLPAFLVEGRGGQFVLGPTHEEVATITAMAEVESFRDLPVNIYQVQTKFRDEARPRFGLLRTREFIMADAYSFDVSRVAMGESYRLMYDAYCRIFDRCGLSYSPVEAAAGAIGGDVNHEFMVPSSIGEDYFAHCPACGYAANTEAAEAGERVTEAAEAGERVTEAAEAMVEYFTPGCPGIDAVIDHFRAEGHQVAPAQMLKCIALVDADNKPVIALVPGDRDVRIPSGMRAFDDADFEAWPVLVKGYIGPMGLGHHGVRVLADLAIRPARGWTTGANRVDHHVTGAMLGRDFEVDEWLSLATVAGGDPCPRCGTGLELVRSVEAGHTFQLGLTYSAKIAGAEFLDEDGVSRPAWMGCYGIGVTRLPAVVAEEHHDEAGLTWPAEIAPFKIHLLALGAKRDPAVGKEADRLYDELCSAGISVLYDDRDVSPGVKFADADLLGMPTQLVVGSKGLARGIVERKDRSSGARDELDLGSVVANLAR
ncbi:MAG: proline--tRNA ligase [Acidimicrobiales bacterium]